MPHKILRLDTLADNIRELANAHRLLSSPFLKELLNYSRNLEIRLESPKASWNDFESFWPPRYVEALINGNAIIFFGSGISLPCGIPTWGRLLTENLGLDRSIAEDEELISDPLTTAELASQHLGSEKLQDVLRRIMNRPNEYSINHLALCGARCPVYVTTNYDCLFEKAWSDINPQIPLVVVTSDAELNTSDYLAAVDGSGTILFKIHGSADRLDEHMILTRRDYRFHYRANRPMFDAVRKLLEIKHTLFVGFGHRDPEISRLIDDAIHEYEEKLNPRDPPEDRPQFYSLQFDMKSHTTEAFAARGIVALNPPAVATEFDDIKTKALAVALLDLVAARQRNLHARESLDTHLSDALRTISSPLMDALDKLSAFVPQAQEILLGPQGSDALQDICNSLGPFASQGVYLLDEQGNVHDYSVPKSLEMANRGFVKPLNHRPYFQQAKLFREPYVSNSAKSLINGQSTFFLCVPVIEQEQMTGLLFGACQIGQWSEPIEFARTIWANDRSFILMDGNGTCLLPPMDEFDVHDALIEPSGEPKAANSGYSFDRLYALSRRDKLIRHIGRNVVPVAQDDDVLQLSDDLRQYTVVSQIPGTSWKVGVSVVVQSDGVSS